MQLKNFLFYPLITLKKILNFIKIEINELFNSKNKRYSELIHIYESCGLKKGRVTYLNHLNKVLKLNGFAKYNEHQGMYSEHLIIFAAISITKPEIKNILEIGTHNGQTACILSSLFPEANIKTIDLKDNDPIFIGTYKREQNYKQFIQNRNNLISNYKNIEFIQVNSLELSLDRINIPKQDLIWIDGAHGYPIVTSDITNAIKLMNSESILMCDDIWKKNIKNDRFYNSIAGFETLMEYSKAKILKNYFFRKRIGKLFNRNYKFVSYSKLVK